MGGGLPVERLTHRQNHSLTGLFWSYLARVLAGLLALGISALFCFQLLVNMGAILPANTAAMQLDSVCESLQSAGRFDPSLVPHYYRWLLLSGQQETASNMTASQLSDARAALAGQEHTQLRFYPRFHRRLSLADGSVCLLQYDYSVPYADPALQATLPDFQLCYLAFWGMTALLFCAWQTQCSARVLRQDAAALAAACDAVRRRCLDEPTPCRANIRELQAALSAIDLLRQELAVSLKEQWATDQAKTQAMAALAHDLKTPLTVIIGNAELLWEDPLPEQLRQNVQAILRSAGSAGQYLEQLRQITCGACAFAPMQPESLADAAEQCAQAVRDRCQAAGLCLRIVQIPTALSGVYVLCLPDLVRSAENLADNAARYSPANGCVTLRMEQTATVFSLVVEDEGPGFSREALARAGRDLFTEDSSRPQNGHMGMGLFFASRTARRHGGRLELENGKAGARVTLQIPLRPLASNLPL